ncbi:hypothetical protein ATANTOWER_014675 [Ataeniobius toweri]|uniref:Uncharacterized protein n=1 Tax=Ataeniobius toweri TaxID=208326 RepID=A0ABU7C1N6_9TELE|nr:hypothetical protein [Ataeniobius toweri]
MSLGWPGNTLGSPWWSWGGVWGEGHLGVSAESAAPATGSRINGRQRVRVDLSRQQLWTQSFLVDKPPGGEGVGPEETAWNYKGKFCKDT